MGLDRKTAARQEEVANKRIKEESPWMAEQVDFVLMPKVRVFLVLLLFRVISYSRCQLQCWFCQVFVGHQIYWSLTGVRMSGIV